MGLLPARAGMIPIRATLALVTSPAPRTRGDDPEFRRDLMTVMACSPHARG